MVEMPSLEQLRPKMLFMIGVARWVFQVVPVSPTPPLQKAVGQQLICICTCSTRIDVFSWDAPSGGY